MESPFRYVIKDKSYKQVRYLIDDNGVISRDQYGKYDYSLKTKGLVESEMKHKITKKEKENNLDFKRFGNKEFNKLPKIKKKADRIAGCINISDEAIAMANKYIWKI